MKNEAGMAHMATGVGGGDSDVFFRKKQKNTTIVTDMEV
jgi:hypothetical protein